MTTNTFGPLLAYDPATGQVARNASGQVYATREGGAPLTVTTLAGAPLSEVMTNSDGIVPAFVVEDHDEVFWRSGAYVFQLVSLAGIRDKVVAFTEGNDIRSVVDSSLLAYMAANPPTSTAGVVSLNGQTGNVTLSAADVGAASAAQGAKADTAVQPGALDALATKQELTTGLAAKVNSSTYTAGIASKVDKPTGTGVRAYDATAGTWVPVPAGSGSAIVIDPTPAQVQALPEGTLIARTN